MAVGRCCMHHCFSTAGRLGTLPCSHAVSAGSCQLHKLGAVPDVQTMAPNSTAMPAAAKRGGAACPAQRIAPECQTI